MERGDDLLLTVVHDERTDGRAGVSGVAALTLAAAGVAQHGHGLAPAEGDTTDHWLAGLLLAHRQGRRAHHQMGRLWRRGAGRGACRGAGSDERRATLVAG